MIREYIGTGKTVEEAIEAACTALGCDRDKIDFEIISLAKKSFFGLRTTPAQVKVTYEDGLPEPRAERPRETREPRREKQSAPKPAEKPADKPAEKPAKKEPAPEKKKPAPAGKPEKKPEKQPAPEPAAPEQKTDEDLYHTAPLSEEIPAGVKPRADAAAAYLTSGIAAMGVRDFHITPKMRENTLVLMIEGEDLGVVIGRRGETLDSLQYLTGLVCNRGEGDYVRVNLDSGNYREKRTKTLEELAVKVARNAVRTGRSTTLEPMNPYDRRIIHASVARVEGAVSSSVGEEPGRRVVISSANPQKAAESDSRRSGGYRGSRGRGGRSGDRRRNDRNRRPAQEARREDPAPRRTEPRKEAEDKPLYGKIEL